MIFLKTFNNSAALVQDDQGQEQVVLGKGVGFGLKKGDKIDENKIERRLPLLLIKMKSIKLKKSMLQPSI